MIKKVLGVVVLILLISGIVVLYIRNKDEEVPVLELQEVIISKGETYKLSDFIVKCTDNSNIDCNLSFEQDKMKNYTESGTYEIVIIASDNWKNITVKATKLTINDSEEKVINTEEITEDNYKYVEEKTESTTEKYGTKITTRVTKTYKVDDEGNKTIYKSSSKNVYDKSNYNATTSQLKVEATTMPSQNVNINNQILENINEYRDEVGLSALTLDYELSVVASIRALELAYGKYDSNHLRPDGRYCFTVFDDLGIYVHHMGENIGHGWQGQADKVSIAWKQSPSHYANIIDAKFTKTGIAYIYTDDYYWVQIFSD